AGAVARNARWRSGAAGATGVVCPEPRLYSFSWKLLVNSCLNECKRMPWYILLPSRAGPLEYAALALLGHPTISRSHGSSLERIDSVLPGFFSEKRWQGMANSRLSAITTCGRALHHGGTYAQVHRHPDTVPSLSLRNRLLPASPGIPLGRQSHRRGSLDGPLRRRRSHLLDLRDLSAAPHRSPRGDLCHGPLRQPVLPRGAQTPCQRLLRQATSLMIGRPPQATSSRRHRSDPPPLLRPVFSRQQTDLPQPGQARDQLILRLCHRLSGRPRRAVHPGCIPGHTLGVAQRGAPRAAGAGEQGRAQAWVVALGPWFSTAWRSSVTCSGRGGRS